MELASIADRVRALRERPVLPEVTLKSLQLWFRTQHVYHSNAIEGSTLTLAETQVVIGDGLTVGGKPLRDVLAAKNLAGALDWVEHVASEAQPISESLIRSIHELVMRGEDTATPGRYKLADNLVSGAEFRPPSFLQTPPLMDALSSFISSSESEHPVVVSAIAHAWLVGIHPFIDGNGRTARLVANLLLLRRGYPIALLTLDRRPDYYASLDRAHCSGDATDFVRLWCQSVVTTLAEYERYGGVLEARERDVEYLADLVHASRTASDEHFQQWSDAVDLLGGELKHLADSLNKKLPREEGHVDVEAQPLNLSQLAQARNGLAPVIRIRGQLDRRPFSTDVSLGQMKGGTRNQVCFVLPWADSQTGAKRLLGMEVRGARLTLVWEEAEGRISREPDRTFGEAANVLFREAVERTAGLTNLDPLVH